MNKIIQIKNISELNKMLGIEKPRHPLIAIIDFNKIKINALEKIKATAGFYTIMLKGKCNGSLKYGRQYYDFQEGTLLFLAPNQVMSFENNEQDEENDGRALLFHPDLLRGTPLADKIKNYNFFSYEVNEALHLSDAENNILNDILDNIRHELSMNIDAHSQILLASNIELLLNYCMRFYDRQFITRKAVNLDLLSKFEDILKNYFSSEQITEKGLPSVKYCAKEMHLSPNYLSDLLKKETGKTAQDHIHDFVIETAKNKLLGTNAPVSQIAYELCFEYPQYFSKIFKKKTKKLNKKTVANI